MTVVALLHPGAMGARVGGELATLGHEVRWCPSGRSAATAERAADEGLVAAADLAAALDGADVALSVLPPQAALPVARDVATTGFTGTYVEANPLGPATLDAVVATVRAGGATVVDAGIVGPPPRPGSRTSLYLAGDRAAVDAVVALVTGSALTAVPIGSTIGQASAAKQAYALANKGRYVLAVTASRLAAAHGVSDVLAGEQERAGMELLGDLDGLTDGLAEVGWRWGPEMDELAAALDAVGEPGQVAGSLAHALARFGPSGPPG